MMSMSARHFVWQAASQMRSKDSSPRIILADCSICHGERWVCEAHPDKPWRDGKGCGGEPGVPCTCNAWAKKGLELTKAGKVKQAREALRKAEYWDARRRALEPSSPRT